MSDTPRTDAHLVEKILCTEGGDDECTVYPCVEHVEAEISRALERELGSVTDEPNANGSAHARIAWWKVRNDELNEEIARLNGQTRWQCACGGTDCAGQRAHEQLRNDVQFVIDHAGRTIETEHGDIKCGALWMAEQLGAALDTAQVVKALRTAEGKT